MDGERLLGVINAHFQARPTTPQPLLDYAWRSLGQDTVADSMRDAELTQQLADAKSRRRELARKARAIVRELRTFSNHT